MGFVAIFVSRARGQMGHLGLGAKSGHFLTHSEVNVPNYTPNTISDFPFANVGFRGFRQCVHAYLCAHRDGETCDESSRGANSDSHK